MDKKYELPTIPETGGPIHGIDVSIDVLGIKYSARFPLNHDADEIGKIVAETIRRAPKNVSWS